MHSQKRVIALCIALCMMGIHCLTVVEQVSLMPFKYNYFAIEGLLDSQLTRKVDISTF